MNKSDSVNERIIEIGDFVLNYDQMSATKNDKIYSFGQKE